MGARALSWWGWGYEDAAVPAAEREALAATLAAVLGSAPPPGREPVALSDIALPRPRVAPAGPLAAVCAGGRRERVAHAVGRSFRDVVRALRGDLPHVPDVVARPADESEVAAVLDWCSTAGVAVIPFGGGTSVVGGVEPDVGDGYAGALSLDMRALDRVLDVDLTSLAVHAQAGITGPALEEALRPHGLTLRHFPQSFEFSTLGGWLATRSGGHYATLRTHIDDFVEQTRMLTPRGVLETRRLPASGAGPDPDRLVLGSEGALGVITSAWMRVVRRPVHRAGRDVRFATTAAAAQAARALAQSGLHPANCRLLDATEALVSGAGDGASALLLVGFESADHPVDASLLRALELCADHGGTAVDAPPRRAGTADAGTATDTWRSAFLRAPYVRDALALHGFVVETFETAVTWDRFEAFTTAVTRATVDAAREACGSALVAMRLTHLYPDGCAPYFTVIAPSRDGDQVAHWDAVKAAATEAITAGGGTVTHHHAVGRDHRRWYDRERPDLFARALAAAKREVDPAWVLNPGVLVDRPQVTGAT